MKNLKHPWLFIINAVFCVLNLIVVGIQIADDRTFVINLAVAVLNAVTALICYQIKETE